MRHELFEYEGRISQLVKLVEIDVPQSIGALNRIMLRLEEYNAVRAADPRASYDDVSMARAIWSEEESKSADDTVTKDGQTSTDDKDSESNNNATHIAARKDIEQKTAE
jgi:hypothetical protein